MTYQNLGFWIAQANDTSTGRHPTGWTNGQRWSETAGEWTTMYDSSQSALGSMTSDRDTWQGRANNAWGSSRVWNSGSSFETDSATWHTRADQAWGTSRVWNSGESWEAAYNRVLPPAAAVVLHNTLSGTLSGPWTDKAVLTTDRAGYWIMTVAMNLSSPTLNADLMIRFRWGGTTGTAMTQRIRAGASTQAGWSTSYDGPLLLAAGTQIAVQTSGSDGGFGGDFYAVFVPVQGYPH